MSNLPDAVGMKTAPITVRVPVAAAMLGIGRSKLYHFLKSGEIEKVKVGRATLIPVASLEAFVAQHRCSLVESS